MRSAALAPLLFALAGCSAATPPDRSDIAVVPLPHLAAVPPPEAEDHDRALRRRVRAAVEGRPALQRLPWLAQHLAIDISGVTSDGRLVLLVLLVRSDLDRAAAGRAYRAFLERAADNGRAYVPTFRDAD